MNQEKNMPTAHLGLQPITVRPATRADFPAIARLLIQLYSVELPGALRGPDAGQQRLLEFTLQAKQDQGLQGRYVACDKKGDILATATLEYPGVPPYDRAPDGTLGQALSLLGHRATLRLLSVVAQSLVRVPRPRTPDIVWLHSVVVDEHQRGRGIGQTIMRTVEEQASAAGYRAAWLQVLARNQPARQLYQRLDYAEAWSTPRWQQTITWPSLLMHKVLPPASA